jgi:RHS repeat-associated protein
MLKRVFLALLPVLALSIHPFVSSAQVATGTYTLGTYDSLGVDTINVGNLNVMLDIPVLHKAGRAGTNFTYDLFYNGSIYTPPTSSGQPWNIDTNFGWASQTLPLTGYLTESTVHGICVLGAHTVADQVLEDVVYHDYLGISHIFTGTKVESVCNASNFNDTLTGTWSTDNQYYYDGADTLTNIRGATINPQIGTSIASATYTDPNGNVISLDNNGNFKDTTGSTVLSVSGNAPANQTFTYKDASGTSRSVVVSYQTYTLATNFGCSGIAEYSATNVPLVHQIQFPDSSSDVYTFTYEQTPGAASSVTGRLASVTLPTGGTIAYTYTGANDGINCVDGSNLGITRQMTTASGSPQRAYTRTISGTQLSHTSVIDELGNDTEYDFVQGSNGSSSTKGYYQTARTVYQGTSGTPLLSSQTCYNRASQPCNQQTLTPPVTQTDTYQTFDGIVQSGTTITYDSLLDVTSTAVYDFGSATARGSVLQTEATPYSNGYLQSDTTKDSAGNTLAETAYVYGPGTVATSGVPSFSATSANVNVLSIQRYPLGGVSGYYTQQLSYYNTGSLYSATGALGPTGSETTTLSYDSTNTFPTSATAPSPTGATLTVGATTDLTSGVPLTSTGVNGAVSTNSSFDALSRPQSSVTTSGSQTMASATATYQPNHVQTLSYQSAGVSTESDTYFDAYGRTVRSATQASASPALFYIVDTCYDGMGHVSFKSYAYTASSVTGSEVCSGAGDSYTYDALGRLLKVQHADSGSTAINYTYYGSATQVSDENGVGHIYQVDGLGRTSVVCEVSSNTSMPNSGTPVSCGTLIAGTGFVTSYAYLNNVTTVTQGAQTRIFTYDGLGRLVSKTESEVGAAGSTSPTTTYSYSVNSTGQVVTRVTPQANQTNPAVTTTTTYQYDLLGRLVSISYYDGVTPTKTFTYDQALSGSTFSTGSSLGMMTAASNTASTTQFSYDPLGRVQGTSQCLAGMCGAAPTSVTRGYGYDWQGNQASEQYSTPSGLVSLTYGVNLAGQLISVAGGQDSAVSSSLYAATAASMSPFGPTGASYGNGIAAVMGYDVFGHPTGMGLTQSSTPLYAWTATWSGQRVASSGDTVNGGSATYTYDDMNRLSAATMGSLNLSWSYDRYGNRWSQSASGTWPGTVTQPSLSFSNTTNRITTAGYAYDAAGNLTQDPQHTYTYDADGNLTAIDYGATATYQYDALNRRVQAVTPSGTQEFDFNAAGQRATVWDGSGNLVSAQYYAGGQPFAYYLAADGHVRFRHQDWIGTERLRTTYNGSVEGTFLSLPYGDGLQTTTGSDTDASHYTGLDQDATDIEHATHRELASGQGRWLRPDPYDGSYSLSDPQSMNRYAYAGNSPVSDVDPLGTIMMAPIVNGGCDPDQSDCGTDLPGGGGQFDGVIGIFTVTGPNGPYQYDSGTYGNLVSNGYGVGLWDDGYGDVMSNYGQVASVTETFIFFNNSSQQTLNTVPTGSVTIGAPNKFDPNDPSYQLAKAVSQRTVSLNNGHAYACFFGASAAIATGITVGAATVTGLEAAAAFRYLYALVTNGGVQAEAYFAYAGAASTAAAAVAYPCTH